MNSYNFKQKVSILQLLLVIAFLFLACAGCSPITSADVSGTYARNGLGVVDTIILRTNGIFDQTITFTNGSKWSIAGAWRFKYQVVELDGAYSVFDPEHNTIRIPPLITSQTVLVEYRKLIKNEQEPKWLKK